MKTQLRRSRRLRGSEGCMEKACIADEQRGNKRKSFREKVQSEIAAELEEEDHR